MYRRELSRRHGADFVEELYRSPEDLDKCLERAREPVLVVVPHFLTPNDLLAAAFQRARSRDQRIIVLDGHDQTSSPHLALLPYVDRYIKSKMLREASAYQSDYLGGYVFSDFYARTYDFDLDGWHFGAKPDTTLVERLVPGWNFAVTRSLRYWMRVPRFVRKRLSRRPYDINLRVALAYDDKWEWYQDYRAHCLDATRGLRDRFRATGQERVGAAKFRRELRNSKIVFSPFGWGEVCWRDYEAVAVGALLLKPSCDHLITNPNIYVDGETYVAVRWDNSDLDEKVDYYLRHLDEAQRIVDNASEALRSYFERGGFLQTVEQTLML